ncbi:MAG: hypothetical protein ACXWWC_05275 [Chitinophagaceae bacterium]
MKKILLLIFLPLQIFSQDFTGTWTGYINTVGNQLPYELVVSESNSKLTGYSLTIFTIDNIENTGIKIMKVKSRNGKISIEDDDLIYNNYTTLAKPVTLFSTLSLEKEDTVMILQGPFYTRSVDRSSFKGTIRLQKKNNSSATKLETHLNRMNILSSLSFMKIKEIEKRSEPVADAVKTNEPLPGNSSFEKDETTITAIKRERSSQPVSVDVQNKKIPASSNSPVVKDVPAIAIRKVAADITTRKTEIIRNVFFQSDSLILSLYDNGEIDGDTVSVVVNDNIIIANQRLSAAAISTTLYTTAALGDSLRLIMYAENLGTIPPNTGVLIIQDGNERHQIRFEGDFQKNSAIILRRK